MSGKKIDLKLISGIPISIVYSSDDILCPIDQQNSTIARITNLRAQDDLKLPNGAASGTPNFMATDLYFADLKTYMSFVLPTVP
jgi:hypothetical protein